jgi:lipoprotein NlpI
MAHTTCTFESVDPLALNNAGVQAMDDGDLATALGAFAVSSFLESAGSIRSDFAHQRAGAALWLMGERHAAAGLWRQAVHELGKGRITHSDDAGGVHSGLLLWYAWRRTGEDIYANEAETHLLRLWRKPRSASWPGPLAAYILGKVAPEALLATAEASGSLRPRHLTQAHFYVGLELFAGGDLPSAVAHFREAEQAALDLSLREVEFYLARHELAQANVAV